MLPPSSKGGACNLDGKGCPSCLYPYSCINGKCDCPTKDTGFLENPKGIKTTYKKCGGDCSCGLADGQCGTRYCRIKKKEVVGNVEMESWYWWPVSAAQFESYKPSIYTLPGEAIGCVCGCGYNPPDPTLKCP